MKTIRATISNAGAAVLYENGEVAQEWQLSDVSTARRTVLGAAEVLVRELDAPHRLEVDDQGTEHAFVLHPNGNREPAPVTSEPDRCAD